MPSPMNPSGNTGALESGHESSSKSAAYLLLDAVMAISLIVALGIVYSVDRSSNAGRVAEQPLITEQDRKILDTKQPTATLRLAVTEPLYDDMGKLLDALGEGYKHETIAVNDLTKADTFSRFDVIFLTCGGIPNEWVAEQIGPGSRSMTLVSVKSEIEAQLRTNLREFVGGGGTLYVSDLHFPDLASAFSEFVDPGSVDEGVVQKVEAHVVDERLKEALGQKNLTLEFDQPDWRVAAFAGHGVERLLEGEYINTSNEKRTGPLLVKFPLGKGTVIFTSFHNEVQNSKVEMELLKFLVFSTIAARSDATVRETMVKGGFSPQRSSLLSTSEGELTVTKSYDCRDTGSLTFALAFENQGARLELTVVDPEGKRQTKEGAESFQIEYENGKVGTWEYTVKAKSVPYANFPFTLTVWSK